MGNITDEKRKKFRESHPKFEEYLNKIQEKKCDEKYKFKQLFMPLTSNKIPFDNLFHFFIMNQNENDFRTKVENMYMFFFEKMEEKRLLSSLITLITHSKKIETKTYETRVNDLFGHNIDQELKIKLLALKPNEKYMVISNKKNFFEKFQEQEQSKNTLSEALALREVSYMLNNFDKRITCRIIKCNCNAKTLINNKNNNNLDNSDMNNYFKKIEKENNSKFPLEKLLKLINDYNKYSLYLTKVIIDYLKRNLLKNFIDYEFFQSFFTDLLSTSENNNEDDKLKLIFKYCSLNATSETKKKNINYLLYKTENVSILADEIQNVNNFITKIKRNEHKEIKQTLIDALDSLSLIPFIEFEILANHDSAYKFINLILLSPHYRQYLKDKIKAKALFYCFKKDDLENILNALKNNQNFDPTLNFVSCENLLDKKMFRLKKGINYKEKVMFIDEIFFKFIKTTGISWNISKWGAHLQVQTIVYEITNDCEIPKDAIYEKEGNIVYEIEVLPVCVILSSIGDENKNNNNDIDLQDLLIENENKNDLFPQTYQFILHNTHFFSRKTKLKEVISTMLDIYTNNSNNNVSVNETVDYVISDTAQNIITIDNIEKTLEEYKLLDTIFFVVRSSNEQHKSSDFSENKDINYQTSSGDTNEMKVNEKQLNIEEEQKIKSLTFKEETTPNDNTNVPLKFSNTSNICFLNSVMQLFINLPLFKEYLTIPKFVFINEYSENAHGGILAKAFLETLHIRWSNDLKKKEIIYDLSDFKKKFGLVIKQFDSSETQDANEFLNLILDELNEEFNLKYKSEQNNNLKYSYDNEFKNILNWSNSIKKSTSIINAIFSFQLQSILTCQECKRKKISYEFNTSLFVAVPEPKQIQFRIYLYKLPFLLKIYYDKINKSFQNALNEGNKKFSFQQKLKVFLYDNIIHSEDFYLKTCLCPISFDFKIDKNKTISEFTDILRKEKNLDIEIEQEFTNLLVYGQTKEDKLNNKEPSYYEDNLTIEQCIQNKQDVYVYEVLNSKGLESLNEKIIPNSSNASPLDDIQYNNEEFKIAVIHFTIKKKDEYFLRQYQREALPIKSDYIILKNNLISAYTLYEIISCKYCKYFQTTKQFWWKTDEINKSYCYPFTIKIMEQTNDKDILTCPCCGWWRFCTGCVIKPSKEQRIIIPDISKSVIVIDWCNSIFDIKQLHEKSKHVIEYNYLSEQDNNKADLTLQQCLNNHFKIEYLDETIKCESCQKNTSHTKQCLFDSIMPPVLIITLNRFKYTKVFKTKLDNLIEYPLYDLQINNDLYDLYGVINHLGTLNSGHYTAILKIKNNDLSYNWMSFNDINYEVIPDKNVVNQNAYILVYINKNSQDKDYLNLVIDIIKNINSKEIDDIMNNSEIPGTYKVYPSKFYKGEPILINSIQGCYFEQEDDLHSTIITENGKEKIETSEIQHDVCYEINNSIIKMNSKNKENKDNLNEMRTSSTLKDIKNNNCIIN